MQHLTYKPAQGQHTLKKKVLLDRQVRSKLIELISITNTRFLFLKFLLNAETIRKVTFNYGK